MSGLDQMVKKHVVPAMSDAGFTKSGGVFQAVGSSGDHAFLWYQQQKSPQPDTTRFFVTASIQTTTYWAFINRAGAEPTLRPSFLFNSLVLSLQAPRAAALWPNADGAHLRQTWGFTAESRATCGESMAKVLSEDVAPWLIQRLDRQTLVAEIEDPTKPWRGAPHGKAAMAVMALLDDGPIPEIERRLPQVEDVTDDGSFTEWITSRLDARRGAL